MWPLKMTARGAEFRWRWFQKSPWRLEVIWGHFGAILGPFQANLWPQIQNCRRLVMWPLKTTARGAEFWWRWFRKSLWTCWGHLGQFWGHFGAIWGYFGTVLGLNLKLSQTSHVTTQNDRKRSRNPMEMVSEVNFKMLRSFQDHLGPFEAILELFFGLNLKLSQTSHVTTQNDRKRSRNPMAVSYTHLTLPTILLV